MIPHRVLESHKNASAIALAGLAAVALALAAWVVSTAAVLIVKLLQWAKAFEDWVRVEVLPKLPGYLREIDAAMWAWADAAKQALYAKVMDIGEQLVAGIRQGVSDAWGSFMNWIDDQIKKIPEAVRIALGIESPSKVMAVTVGQPIVQGIIKGIYDAYPLLDAAVNGLVGKVTGPMQAMADFAHKMMAEVLAAAVSTARQAVGNLDAMMAITEQARTEHEKARQELVAASAELEKVRADGDAAIAAAQAKVDAANALLAGAATPEEIAAAQQAVADAQAALQAARDAAAKATADAQLAFTDSQEKFRAAQAAYYDASQISNIARQQLNQAQQEAAEISKTNAQAGAEYLAMRSQQILELANLEAQRRQAVRDGDIAEVQQLDYKKQLIIAAQAAELAQFQQHAQDLATAIQQQVAQMAEQGRSAGESFVQGIIQGMTNNALNLAGAMEAAVQAAIDAVRKALGIASPSKVFVEIGGFMSEGMAIGAQSKAAMLATATSKVAQQAISTANNTVTNWNLNANYKTQGEQSLRDDIVMLSMLKGRK